MTAEEHNKYVAYAHVVYAALQSLFGIGMSVMMGVMLTTLPNSPRDRPPPPAFIAFIIAVILVFTIGWVVPSMLAAYSLLKRKRWARTMSIVAAVFAAAQLPIGTAVAVYTFWFVFSNAAGSVYGHHAYSGVQA